MSIIKTEKKAEKTLIAKALTQAEFSSFGDVIELSDKANHFTINYGLTERYHALADIDVESKNGKGIISIFHATPKALPVMIDCMERHPLSSQAFFPLSQQPYLVVVAPKGEFDENALQAFIVKANQGVNYHKGTWHHYCLALEDVSDFLVVDRQGEGENCDEVNLSAPFQIKVE